MSIISVFIFIKIYSLTVINIFGSWWLSNHLLSRVQSGSYDVGAPFNVVLDLLRWPFSERMKANLTVRLVNKTNWVIILWWWLQWVVTKVWEIQVFIFLLIVHAFFEEPLVRLCVPEAAAGSVGKSASASFSTLFTSTSSSQTSCASFVDVGAL